MSKTIRHNEIEGLVFNVQRFSVHDGPGIRTTVFMKGCPLRCKWCSNPESQESYPEIMTADRKCIKCAKCVECCPMGAITLDETGRRINREKCNLCMECARNCPSGAIEAVGKYLTVGEVIAEIEEDKLFYQNSGGGITISGGEPLLQWEFALDLLKECKVRNLRTSLDTCGYARWDVMEKVLGYVDLVLYDIKDIDSAKHREATGVSNELILSNAEKVSGKVRTWLRYAVIPSYNDSPSDIKRMARFASSIPIEKVSLLPYHGLGEQKYERLGRMYPLSGISPPTEEHLKNIAKTFESLGLKVTIGY